MLAWSGRTDSSFRIDQQLEYPQDLGLTGRWALLTTAQEREASVSPKSWLQAGWRRCGIMGTSDWTNTGSLLVLTPLKLGRKKPNDGALQEAGTPASLPLSLGCGL